MKTFKQLLDEAFKRDVWITIKKTASLNDIKKSPIDVWIVHLSKDEAKNELQSGQKIVKFSGIPSGEVSSDVQSNQLIHFLRTTEMLKGKYSEKI